MTDDKPEGGAATLTDADVEAAFRMIARGDGIPEDICSVLGVNTDGSPAEGGFTRMAREYAAHLYDRASARHKRKHAPTPRRADPVVSLVEALGLAAPLRAALRGAAEALVEALDTDAAPVAAEGAPRMGERVVTADGRKLTRYTVGDHPYALIRVEPAGEDLGIAAVTVVCGGGAGVGNDATMDAVELIEHALSAAKSGGFAVAPDVDPADAAAAVQRMTTAQVASMFGIDLADLDSAAAAASAAGPSTEWPGSGDVPDHLPGYVEPDSSAAPSSPVHDGGASSPAVSEPSTSSSDSSGPAGGTD